MNPISNLSETIATRLKKAFPDSQIKITDLTGNGNHLELLIVCKEFKGLRPVVRQQKINAEIKDLWDEGGLHALTMKIYTPEEKVL